MPLHRRRDGKAARIARVGGIASPPDSDVIALHQATVWEQTKPYRVTA
jgi:hypothetical protein